MKKIFLLCAVAGVMLLTACSKTTFLNVETNEIHSTISGTSGSLAIHTDGKAAVQHAPSWADVNIDEQTLRLNYQIKQNTTGAEREDSIVIASGKMSTTIKLYQAVKATFVRFNPEVVELPREGGDATIIVETDGEGALIVSDPKIAKVNGREIALHMSYNPKPNVYTKRLKVTCEDVSAELEITMESNACPKCNGKGYFNRPCPECGGEGARMCCNYTGKQQCNLCCGWGTVVGNSNYGRFASE